MKNLVRVMSILMIVVMIVSVASPVFASTNGGTGGGSTGITNPKDLTGTGTTAFNSIGKTIIGMVQALGAIIAVLMLTILGIKYMMGSAEEKAEYKKTMIPYLIGAVLIFAATQIAGMIFNFATSVQL